MESENEKHPSEQDLSSGESVEQEPLGSVEDPSVRFAGYNQIPDFGDDARGTLRESEDESSDERITAPGLIRPAENYRADGKRAEEIRVFRKQF